MIPQVSPFLWEIAQASLLTWSSVSGKQGRREYRENGSLLTFLIDHETFLQTANQDILRRQDVIPAPSYSLQCLKEPEDKLMARSKSLIPISEELVNKPKQKPHFPDMADTRRLPDEFQYISLALLWRQMTVLQHSWNEKSLKYIFPLILRFGCGLVVEKINIPRREDK